MKTHLYGVFMSIGLLLSPLLAAQTMSIAFQKSWGPGTLVKSTSASGVLQHVTGGKGEPDFLRAPLKLGGFSGKNLFFDIRIDGMKNFSGFEVRLGDAEFENYYLLNIPYFDDPDFNIIQDGYWHTYSFGLSNATVVGQPEQKITHIGIYIQDNGNGPLKIELTRLRFQSAPARGYVSLTFDDGYIDHYYAAGVMHKYAMPGTAYVMPRQIGEPGYMTLRQVVELKEKYHWGISSHHAIPYTDFSPTDLVREIGYTIDFLALNGFAESAPHLAYPLGRQERKMVLPTVREHFETARVAGGGAETLPPADPHLLRTINVMDTTRPEELVAEVNQAVTNGQWAILMFHYLADMPQSPIEYSKKDFEKFIELLAKTDVQVLPVHEVYRKFKTTRTATKQAAEN